MKSTKIKLKCNTKMQNLQKNYWYHENITAQSTKEKGIKVLYFWTMKTSEMANMIKNIL